MLSDQNQNRDSYPVPVPKYKIEYSAQGEHWLTQGFYSERESHIWVEKLQDRGFYVRIDGAMIA